MSCTTILVGAKASYDGSTIIARNDDGGFVPKKMIVVEANKQPTKYKCVISHLEIDLPKKSLRYSSTPSVAKDRGLWPACGINEKNVAMTATETITSNPLVKGSDPLVTYTKQGKKEIVGGIGEEDLVTIVLPYISSARQGVIRTGELLEKYGTYEMNGMAFADEKEVWWLETIGGHHFIATRVPDDCIFMLPNYFNMNEYDIDDGCGKQINNICSKDLKKYIKDNHLDTTNDKKFNPRTIFGSHSDHDHIYNTPRAWYMLKYFNPTKYDWINNPPYTPISDNIPCMCKPERKVTIEDIKYILSSHYQGTAYDPYCKEESAGRYRVIGVPNSDNSGILQIRGYMPKELKGVEWMSLGGSGFTACIPQYVNVNDFPAYLSKTTKEVSTDYLYWNSRIIAALVDAQFVKSSATSERYVAQVFNEAYRIINEYDKKMIKTKDYSLCKQANDELVKMLKEKTQSTLDEVLETASEYMKTRYHRNDN
ncbi:MAG: C69 family dipeptidase [Erysipelotrichaceae bacterium]|nr:C69 family dipeptidase [Erysipelotrichaceae bacterium]